MNNYDTALTLLPLTIRSDAAEFADRHPEEIRLRLGRTATVLCNGCEIAISSHLVSHNDICCVMEKSTEASIHSSAAAMSGGYINFKGIRIGICGIVTIQNGIVAGFRNISSLAIRVPKECRGICSDILDRLEKDGFKNTLIIGPPGVGKTTALRELVRCLSDRGLRIGIADERNEVSGSIAGGFNFDLGEYSDVIAGAPKTEAAMMLLRGMNPQIIAMDEITRAEDIETIREIYGCGVGILASIHSKNTEDMKKRELYRELIDLGAFDYAVVISNSKGRRNYILEELKR